MSRLKYLISLSPSVSETPISLKDKVSFIPMDSIHDGLGGIDPSRRILLQEAKIGSYNYLSNGDVLLAKVTPCFENGKKGLAENLFNGVGFATSEVFVLRPNTSKILPQFLIYLLSSVDFRSDAIMSMTGSGGLKRISAEAVRNLHVSITDVSLQASIVQFLDHETTRIDRLIKKNNRFIELLNAKRTALIYQTVTKGLEVAVPMKASSIQWIGDIPNTWKLVRIGNLFTERKQKVSDKDYRPLSVTKTGIHPQLESVAKTDDGDNRKLVRAGDFVINSRSDRKGSSGVSSLEKALINIVLELKNITPEFCNYVLKSHAFVEEYYRMGHGIVADLWTTPFDKMRTIIMPLPSIKEQHAIAAFLDRETTRIDSIVAKTQRSIELLKEKRTALITAAVTGRIDIKIGQFVKTQVFETKSETGARPDRV